MGWFTVAAVFGFLLFWTWRNLLHRKFAAAKTWFGKALGPALPLTAIALLAIVLMIWSWFAADGSGLASMLDVIGRGTVARGLLGIVVGFGLAYMIDHRALPASANGGKKKANQSGIAAIGGTSSLVTVGIGAVFLALASPHVDNWLSHLTTLKSPIIELQLGSVASHKVSVAEGVTAYEDLASLYKLRSYQRAIAADIEYFERFDKNNRAITPVKELLPVFEIMLSPIAGCVVTAMENGLSIDSARQLIRPMTDTLAKIIFNPGSPKAAELHENFWKELKKLPDNVQHFIQDSENAATCLGLPDKYLTCVENARQKKDNRCLPFIQRYPGGNFPEYGNYTNVPYLHVAAAFLFSFMTDDDNALRVLRKAENAMGPGNTPILLYKDYSFLMTAARLSYYIGKPGPLEYSYFRDLDTWRNNAIRHVYTLRTALDACAKADSLCKEKNKKLLTRSWNAELEATNNLAYYLAEDLARDSPFAASYSARVSEYAQWLEKTVTEGTKTEALNKYYYIPKSDKYDYMDTYSYAYMVLEARKTSPDAQRFKKLKKDFESITENVEAAAAKDANITKIELTTIKVLRAHLASARELAGE